MSYVNGNNNFQVGPGNTIVLTLGFAIAAGDTACIAVLVTAGTTVTGVADNVSGNTYTIRETATESSGALVYGITGFNIQNGPTQITASFSNGTAAAAGILLDEYSGYAAFNIGSANNQPTPGTGTDAVTSGNATTTAANCLIWGFCANGPDSLTNGTGFTQRQNAAGLYASEDKTLSAAGSTAATFTATAGTSEAGTIMLALVPPGINIWPYKV